MARTNRRTIAVVASLALGVGIAGVACVIADPPAQLPVPPLTRPEILHEEVTPPVTTILRTWPIEFVVPVDVPDPNSPLQWHAFFDYNASPTGPNARSSTFYEPGELDPTGSEVRILSVQLPAPVDMNACHTIEILVALTFAENHTPDSIGGDSITWFYSPTGSLDDCPVYDAGPYDASDDASDGGDAADGSDGGGG